MLSHINIIYNQINQVRVPYYNLYSSNLIYTNPTISSELRGVLPSVLIVNLHFLNDYVPSRAYEREAPSNQFDLIYSGSIFPHILSNNCHLYSFF